MLARLQLVAAAFFCKFRRRARFRKRNPTGPTDLLEIRVSFRR